MDRDYMHEKRRKRPFSPPPERSGTRTFSMVLIFVIALFALYKRADKRISNCPATNFVARYSVCHPGNALGHKSRYAT